MPYAWNPTRLHLHLVHSDRVPTPVALWQSAGGLLVLGLAHLRRWRAEGMGLAEGSAGDQPPEEAKARPFHEHFSACAPAVDRLCRRMLGRGPAADDAPNEVFLRARRAFDTYDGNRPFRPWLLAIANHYCIDQLRRRTTERKIFDDSESDPGELASRVASPLRQTLRAEERNAVSAAIEELPDKYRIPLVLRYFSELDYAAIGEILDVSATQVGTLLFRAKQQLRARLESERP